MRENDDSQVAGHGTLADGLGETAEPGEYSSTSEPYGDGGLDDSYGDDAYGTADAGDGDDEDAYDDSYGDDAYGDGTDTDDSYGDGGGYGDGDVVADGAADVGADPDATTATEDDGIGDQGGDAVGDRGADGVDETDLAHDASPLEGVGYLIDQVHDALFGDDDEASAAFGADALTSAFDTDPADLASDTDLDLTGDGVVNHADLLEAEHSFDFHVGGHEGPPG